MKFRVVAERNVYIVQYKFMFWWVDVKTTGEYTKEFVSIDEAKAAIESFNKPGVVVG